MKIAKKLLVDPKQTVRKMIHSAFTEFVLDLDPPAKMDLHRLVLLFPEVCRGEEAVFVGASPGGA